MATRVDDEFLLFLKKLHLEKYLDALLAMNINSVIEIGYVDEDDLKRIQMNKPEIRRLLGEAKKSSEQFHFMASLYASESEPFLGLLHYKKKREPVLTAFKESSKASSKAGVFRYPATISIHPQTNNVYICDQGNNRVQVFTSSFQFLFQFNKKMLTPFSVCFNENKVYVTQALSNCLNIYSVDGKFLQSVGQIGDKELEFDLPFGVEFSLLKNLIYVCENENNRIQCLNLNLTFNSFILHVVGPRDIKLTQNEIVVLKGGYHCISLFNYSHQFVGEMIRCGEGTPLTKPQFFCLDQQNNILMTDCSSHCVAIFSIRGELIHKFGKKGENRGELIGPTGIALNSDNNIIVLSLNPTNCIQLF